MRTITITLPEKITINGAKNAPQNLRVIETANWEEAFILQAIEHGCSQKIGDTWSVTKGDVARTTTTHAALQAGEWSARNDSMGNEDRAYCDALEAVGYKFVETTTGGKTKAGNPKMKRESLESALINYTTNLAQKQGKAFNPEMIEKVKTKLRETPQYKAKMQQVSFDLDL